MKEIKVNFGDRFTRWIVLNQKPIKERIGKTNSLRTKLLCRCDCGIEKLVRKDYLLKGSSKSCGCLKKQFAIQNGKKQRTTESYLNWFYGNIRGRAKRRKIIFSLSFDQYKEIATSSCYYCGAVPKMWETKDHTRCGIQVPVNTIDRVNSNGNYEKSNCVAACLKCNIMKSNLSNEDFLKHIQSIINYQQLQLQKGA